VEVAVKDLTLLLAVKQVLVAALVEMGLLVVRAVFQVLAAFVAEVMVRDGSVAPRVVAAGLLSGKQYTLIRRVQVVLLVVKTLMLVLHMQLAGLAADREHMAGAEEAAVILAAGQLVGHIPIMVEAVVHTMQAQIKPILALLAAVAVKLS
jgi:hypothetical protein